MPGPVSDERASFCAVRLARASATASAPMKPVSSLQHQPRPAGDRVRARSTGRCRRGESRPPAAACRARRARPASRRAAISASHSSVADPAAPGPRRRPRPCSRCRRRAPPPRRSRRRAVCIRGGSSAPSALRGDRRARPGPGRRASPSRSIESVTSASNAAACSGEPGEVPLVVGGVCDGQVAVVGEPVGEQVVEDPAVIAAEHRVLRAADLELRDVVGEQPLEQVERARARRSRSRPCARRRRRRSRFARRRAPAARPRTAPASPSRRRRRACAPAATCASYRGVRARCQRSDGELQRRRPAGVGSAAWLSP